MALPDRQQSAWLDFLDWVEQPGQAVLNLNRPKAALHHLEDFAAGPLNVLIPGYSIPHQSTKDDEGHASELLGMDPHSTAGRYADVIGDVVANPITWTAAIPGVGKALHSGLVAAGKQAYKGAEKVGLDKPIDYVRRAAGWENVPDEVKLTRPTGEAVFRPHETLARGEGMEEASGHAARSHLKAMLDTHGGITKEEDRALAEIIDNVVQDPATGQHRVLLPENADPLVAMQQKRQHGMERVDAWIAAHPQTQVNRDKLKSILGQDIDYAERQHGELVQAGMLSPNAKAQGLYRKRLFSGMDQARETKERSLQSPEDLARFLNDPLNQDVQLGKSWLESALSRASGQGRKLKQGAILKDLLGDPQLVAGLHASPGSAAYNEAHAQLSAVKRQLDPKSDLARRINYELGGVEPLGPVAEGMRKILSPFKGAAVFGAGPFVRVGGVVRNAISNIAQMATDPMGRQTIIREPGLLFKSMWGGIDDALAKNFTGNRVSGGQLTTIMDAVDQAAAKSGGQVDGMMRELQARAQAAASPEERALWEHAAGAVKNGVINGFVNSEQLANEVLQKHPAWNPLTYLIPGRSKVANIGGKLFQGVETRFRLATYLDAIKQGASPELAAKKVKDIFFPYSYTSGENRALRLVMPFAQYMTQAMKQQAQFLSKNPAVLPAVAALFGNQGDEPLPEYAKEQAGIPIPGGKAVGFGAPMEAFNVVPSVLNANSFEGFIDSNKPLVSALNPLLGMGIGMATGVDTWSGRPYLQDARVPFTGGENRDRNPADVAYGLLEDSGIAQPIAGPLVQAKSLGKMDSGAEAALRWATGINPVTPDPLKVQRDDLTAQLRQAGVPQFSDFFNPHEESDVAQAIDALREARKNIKDRAAREAAVAAPLDQEINQQLANPPKSDRRFHIPMLAAATKDPRNPDIFIDKNLPQQLRTKSGQVFNPDPFLALHEDQEQKAENQGLPYKDAHDIGLAAEHAGVRKAGMDPAEYEAALRPYIKRAAKAKKTDLPPGQLVEQRPYIEEGDRKSLAAFAF